MIAQHRMTRHTAYRIPVFVRRQFLSCQTDSLEDTDVVPDNTGLTDNGSCPVVNREIVSDLRPGWISIPVSEWAISVIMRGIRERPTGIAGAQYDSCRQPETGIAKITSLMF